jgi:hypothetical protein
LREREIYGAKLTSQQSFIQVQKRVCFVTLAHGCSPGSRSVQRSLSALLQWRLTDCDCNATQRDTPEQEEELGASTSKILSKKKKEWKMEKLYSASSVAVCHQENQNGVACMAATTTASISFVPMQFRSQDGPRLLPRSISFYSSHLSSKMN